MIPEKILAIMYLEVLEEIKQLPLFSASAFVAFVTAALEKAAYAE